MSSPVVTPACAGSATSCAPEPSGQTVSDAVEGRLPPPPPPRSSSPPPPRLLTPSSRLLNFLSNLAVPGTYVEAERLAGLPPPPMVERAAATTSASTTTTTTPPAHVHQLRLSQFFFPTLCAVCRAAPLGEALWCSPLLATPPPPPPPSATAAAPAASTWDTPDTPAPTPRQQSASAAATAHSCYRDPAFASPSSPSTAAPSQPFLGLGTEGYRCSVCGITLHLQCLSRLRATQACEVLAPDAHRIPSPSVVADPPPPTSPPPTTATTSSGGPLSWDRVKAMLGNYLDPGDSAQSRRDVNAKAVLNGVFAVLDAVIARYPTLTPLTVVRRYPAIQELGSAHQTLYTACAASLEDTALLDSITWDDLQRHRHAQTCGAGGGTPDATTAAAVMRPLCVSRSVLESITATVSGAGSVGLFSSLLPGGGTAPPSASSSSSSSTTTTATATYPVQLLLWQAMRYATAVYGAVYRRGSLSTTLSATLLFTVNRSGAGVPKATNDAAVTALLELPASALRLSRWAARATEPSYALLVDDAAGRIVVAFRGTLNTFDIMTDLAAVGQPFCGGHAHQGAAEVVNTIFDQRASRYEARVARQRRRPAEHAAATTATTTATATASEATLHDRGHKAGAPPAAIVVAAAVAEPRASRDGADTAPASAAVAVALVPYVLQPLDEPDGLLDGLEQLAAAHPSYVILVTGHSLGGGVAALFAVRLHHDQALPPAVLRRIHVIAFAPMPTLSLPAACAFDEVSCARADGGYSRDTSSTGDPAAPEGSSSNSSSSSGGGGGGGVACFPVWSVVNGLDCVPRLQVNTIDRLLRQVVGPQVAPVDKMSPAAAATTTSASALATADARRKAVQELREQDAAGHDEEEMIDIAAAGATSDGAAHAVPPTEAEDVARGSAEGGVSVPGQPARSAASVGEVDVVVRASAVGADVPATSEAVHATASAGATSRASDVSDTVTPPPGQSTGATPSMCDLSQELHHPGRVLLLTSPWDMANNRLVDVPRGHPVMHELFLMRSMLLQHMVDAYGTALTQLHRDPRRSQ